MSDYMSSRTAILRELEGAENALKGANEAYADYERKLVEAQRTAAASYEGRARIARAVDRLREALRILEGEEE